MKFTKLQFCFLLASWLSISVRADLVAPGSYVKPIQGTVDSVPSGHGQAPSQMDYIFEGYDDLANDIIEAFEDLDERQYELGQEIQRHLQEHLVRDEDGNLEYRKEDILDKVEEVKGHHRNLEASRRLRWDKYYSELEI